MANKLKALEQSFDEIKANLERLMDAHKNLGNAHTKFHKAHSLLLEENKEKVVISCDVGTTCDLVNEPHYKSSMLAFTNPFCTSSSTTTNSTSTTSDGFTCDASLEFHNETLKR